VAFAGFTARGVGCMNHGRMRTPLIAAHVFAALVFAAAVFATAADAAPKKAAPAAIKPAGKSPPTCGVHLVPLVVGSTWTYIAVDSHVAVDPQIARLAPAQPKKVVVSVKSVEPKGKTDFVVTLEEQLTIDFTKDPKKPNIEERKLTTTISCGQKHFDISPESYFFAGEPGGYFGLAFDKLDRVKGTSLQLTNTGGIGDAEWREDLVGHWARTPSPGSDAQLGSGKLELERRFTPQPAENVQVLSGTYHAEKLGLTTTGRVTLDKPLAPEAKPMELPANWITTMWIADNVGVVQTLNSYGHKYQLTDYTLK
jgi:hypothetical protein